LQVQCQALKKDILNREKMISLEDDF
jgi:hypothetical protein